MKLELQNVFPSEDEIPSDFMLPEEVNQREFLCDGEMITWHGEVNDVYSPICVKSADGINRKRIGSYPLATVEESQKALDAAVKAYDYGKGEWPAMSVEQRIECLENFTQKMIAKKDIVVKLIMWEIGKSFADSNKEFDRTVEYMYDTIQELKDLDRESSRFQIEQGIIAQVRRAPLGVVLCMGPFNYPLNETFTTLIPALVMGNTILFKPPKHGTLLFSPLLEAFKTSFPKGVVNTIYGRGNKIVPDLMKSGKIDVLALIGSSKVANDLKKLHPKVNRLRAILGLDAKNAAIIDQKADLDLAVQETIMGGLSFNGQRCTALKIIFVDRKVVNPFLDKLKSELKKVKIGMPWESGVTITPLAEINKPQYLKDCIDDAIAHGASVINEQGGEICESLFYPAVVYPVNQNMKIYREEQFGPIIPIVPYDNIDEPIEYVINSSHGQQVSLFSNDDEVITSLISPLVNQVGRVNINSQCQRGPDSFPFTGRKDSAEGTLSVRDALRSFSIRSIVATKATPQNKQLLNQIIENNKSNFLSTKFIF
ncbi:NADP-dependent glyceraldehyde-3-phosphate dehydrogenase [Sphingobacterium bovisgrunnientis]|uniref:NADP-dependent glyceraldehyde-3-phosphate dehydrogenase n=1 Tax=Sphingobacterium bovisgrunnientis TaxID=1874697 RepID=UPI00135C01D2|nr:NADP-dependent glyceraldehyde-3-phosphate dehydrogenase [Sphingobacterium bovisgrunnientis]